ncbi:hypothetical protein AB0I10_22125 [Streptomyces sp. NPDC050636]|uniref:hypothetical protein n=1 Tax=Streptomyces sp. NPDC050636 TaxID=3154510 RepID=UPI003434876D
MTDALAESLARDAVTLHEDLRAGDWQPSAAEQLLAEGIARTQWNHHSLRAALRDLSADMRAGRLLDVIDPAVRVAEAIGTPAVDAAL